MAVLVSSGAVGASAATVVTPTDLLPGLPAIVSTRDWLFLFTACTLASATVATPAGWTTLYNLTGTNGRVVLFVRRATGADSAPTVTWSGLTTGAAGTPCGAQILNYGQGFGEVLGALSINVQGTVNDQAASTTVMAGGTAVTTTTPNAIVFSQGIRASSTATGIAEAGTGITWTNVMAHQIASGATALHCVSYGNLAVPATLGAHTWTITGGTSVASSGVTTGLSPTLDQVPALVSVGVRMRCRGA